MHNIAISRGAADVAVSSLRQKYTLNKLKCALHIRTQVSASYLHSQPFFSLNILAVLEYSNFKPQSSFQQRQANLNKMEQPRGAQNWVQIRQYCRWGYLDRSCSKL